LSLVSRELRLIAFRIIPLLLRECTKPAVGNLVSSGFRPHAGVSNVCEPEITARDPATAMWSPRGRPASANVQLATGKFVSTGPLVLVVTASTYTCSEALRAIAFMCKKTAEDRRSLR
jgi:hypothetical protein